MCSGTSCTRPFGRLRRHQSFPTIGRTTGALTLTLQKFYLTHKKTRNMCGFSYLAESEGFEPPVGLTPRLISSQVH